MRGSDIFSVKRLSGAWTRAALATALVVGFSGSVGSNVSYAQTADRSDANIQSDVAYALSNSHSLKGQAITAATVDGDVTLSGSVRDEASKELAESLVYRVNGVRAVNNNLTVGGAATTAEQSQGTDPRPGTAPGDPSQDPNYDPAQRNLAPAGPDDQNAAQGPGAEQAGGQQDAGLGPDRGGNMTPPPPPSANDNGGYRQPAPPAGPVTIPSGTLVQVRTSEPLDANRVQAGAVFQGTVATDVWQGGALALPRGAVVRGEVVSATTNKGDVVGKQGLALKLDTIDLGGHSYALVTDTWTGQGPGKGAYTAANTIGGAALGAIIGGIAGRGTGAAIGAGVGGAVGAGASAATTGPRLYLPAEALLNFHLAAPVTVTPVSNDEAQRLARGTYPPRPQLRPPYYGYGYPPPPPPYYAYPYAYYRPGYYYYRYY